MTSQQLSLIDRRADMAACLANNIRRDIRDCLRRFGSLTLHELSEHLNLPEPNLYYHLDQMIRHGIVVKELVKLNGRTTAIYRLSDEYNRLFDESNTQDLTPLYILFFVYSGFTLLSGLFGNYIIPYFKGFGITTFTQLLGIGFVGLLSTLIPILYYHFKSGDFPKIVSRVTFLKNVVRR